MTAPQPQVREFQLLGRDDEPLEIRGRLLGFATSKRDIHTHDDVFTDDEAIETEIRTQEDRMASLPKRFTDAVFDRAKSAIQTYIDELADDDYPRRYAAPGDRCSACRWFEVRIFEVESERAGNDEKSSWEVADAKYLLLTYGLSDVPGEVAKRRAQRTNSPFTVLEALTQRRGGNAFLPATSARVLSEAAAVDTDIADVYVNRAVA